MSLGGRLLRRTLVRRARHVVGPGLGEGAADNDTEQSARVAVQGDLLTSGNARARFIDIARRVLPDQDDEPCGPVGLLRVDLRELDSSRNVSARASTTVRGPVSTETVNARAIAVSASGIRPRLIPQADETEINAVRQATTRVPRWRGTRGVTTIEYGCFSGELASPMGCVRARGGIVVGRPRVGWEAPPAGAAMPAA